MGKQMKLSKSVTTLKKATRQLTAEIDTHGPGMTTKVFEVLEPLATAANLEIPAVGALLRILGLRVEQRTEAASAADQDTTREEREDAAARDTRDSTLEDAYQGALSTKALLSGMYTDSMSRDLGFAGEIPRDPNQLERIFTLAIETVTKDTFALPEPKRANAPVWSNEQITAYLQGFHAPLAQALADLDREVEETKAARITKWKTVSETQEASQDLATFIILLAKIAGEKDLVTRLRPLTRSSKSSVIEVTPPPQDDENPTEDDEDTE